MEVFRGKEGEEIDMVAASGFHGDKDGRGVRGVGVEGVKERGEASVVHISGEGKDSFSFGVKSSCGEGVFRDVNANEKIVHSYTSYEKGMVEDLGKTGITSQPILHSNEGFGTQSTYNGYGRQGTNSQEGLRTQVIWSPPAFPFLLCLSKTHSYETFIIHNF